MHCACGARSGQDDFAGYLQEVEAQARRRWDCGASTTSNEGVTAVGGDRVAEGRDDGAAAIVEYRGTREDEQGRTV